MSYYFVKRFGNRLFVRDTDGDRIITKHPFHFYFPSLKKENTPFKSIDNHPLVEMEYHSVREAADSLKNLSGISGTPIYGMNALDYQYIFDNYRGLPIPEKVKVAVIDIEVEKDAITGYSSTTEAANRISAVTIEYNGTYYTFGLKGYDPRASILRKKIPDIKIHYKECPTESELLVRVVHFFETKVPHIITGWNSKTFDIPYLINRGAQILETGMDHMARLSPFKKISRRTSRDNFGNEVETYEILGISHLDYLELYKKFTYSARENYKLDTIAHVELDMRKIDYSEYQGLQDLADKNWQLFIDYNIRDVDIVRQLEDKMKLIDLVIGLAHKTGVNYEDVYSPVRTWDVFIYRTLAENGIQIPAISKKNTKQSYVGAYVKDIDPCVQSWVVSFDLASLYPHLQMGYNISPEKLIDQSHFTPEMQALVDQMPSPAMAVDDLVNRKYDLDFLKDLGLCLTPNGQFYKVGNDGFIPKMIEGLYSERKETKTEELRLKQVEQSTGENHKNEIAALHNKQMALKILLNSGFGAMANIFFRWYDIRNAEAITSSGQLSIKWIGKALNKFMNDTAGTDGETYVYYSDTDSVYITMDTVVQQHMGDWTIEKITKGLDKFSEDIIQPFIEKSYQELANYVNAHKQKMSMKREVIANRALHTGKKRYIMNVLNSEGVQYAKPKLKMMGIEAVRSSTPEICRDAIKEVVRLILQENEGAVQDYVEKFKKEFFKAPIEDIAFPRGVNEIDKWNDNGLPKKGTPIAVRGAIVYNNFLDKRALTNYNKVNGGDKIRFCYLHEPNILNSNVVSFPDFLPQEMRDQLRYNRKVQFEKAFITPITTLLDACGWKYEKQINLMDFLGAV